MRCCIDSLFKFFAGGLWNACQECLSSLGVHQLDRTRSLELARTGSTTSIHCLVVLSTNSPPIKFFVFPPVALVPCQSADIFSAWVRAVGLKATRGGLDAEVANERARKRRRRVIFLECMFRMCVLAIRVERAAAYLRSGALSSVL